MNKFTLKKQKHGKLQTNKLQEPENIVSNEKLKCRLSCGVERDSLLKLNEN